MRSLRLVVGQPIRVAEAFLRLGYQQAISYPLSFVSGQLSTLLPAVIYFFVAKMLRGQGPEVGFDYFTFVILGLIGVRVMDAGLRGFSHELDTAIQRGWLEMFLTEPVRWRFLPFAMSLWPTVIALSGAVVIWGVSVILGANYVLTGLPIAILVGVLGLLAGLAIGTMAGSVKVLAKSGDPFLLLYSLIAQVFSGVYFTIDVMPAPLRAISWVIPQTYVNLALRKALMPRSEGISGSTLQSLLVLAAFVVVLYPLSLWVYGRALGYGRKLGVLSGY